MANNLGRFVMKWMGTYNAATPYVPLMCVYLNGVSYICTTACTNKDPETETAYWDIMNTSANTADRIAAQVAAAAAAVSETNAGVSETNAGDSESAASSSASAAAASALQLAAGVGSPVGPPYADLAALNTAGPDHGYNYLTLDDGHWAYYDTGTSAFVDSGYAWQTTGIGDNSVSAKMLSFMTAGINLNTSAMELGALISNGELLTTNDYIRSVDFIPIAASTDYIVFDDLGYTYKAYVFNSGFGCTAEIVLTKYRATFNSGAGAAFVKLTSTPAASQTDINVKVMLCERTDVYDYADPQALPFTGMEDGGIVRALVNGHKHMADTLPNIMPNSDFDNAVIPFTVYDSTLTISGGELSITGSGAGALVAANDNVPGIAPEAHKLFCLIKAKVTNANCLNMGVYVGGLSVANGAVSTPVSGQWYDLYGSATRTPPAEAPDITIFHEYADAGTATSKVMKVAHVLAVDLTACFGAGLEPTDAQMYAYLGRYPDHFYPTIPYIPHFSVIDEPDFLNKWFGDTFVGFGDSIMWYDGEVYDSSNEEEGTVVRGYQTHMREKLGCVVINAGTSGYDMTQIYTVINGYDLTGADAVLITSGANDHRKDVAPGTVAAIGAAFNTATYAGAMQASIEAILGDDPEKKIYLLAPLRGWYNESGTVDVPGPYNMEMTLSEDYVDVMKAVGALYGIPVCDLYNLTGINDINLHIYIGDKLAIPYYLHPSTKGYARIAETLIPFLKNY